MAANFSQIGKMFSCMQRVCVRVCVVPMFMLCASQTQPRNKYPRKILINLWCYGSGVNEQQLIIAGIDTTHPNGTDNTHTR